MVLLQQIDYDNQPHSDDTVNAFMPISGALASQPATPRQHEQHSNFQPHHHSLLLPGQAAHRMPQSRCVGQQHDHAVHHQRLPGKKVTERLRTLPAEPSKAKGALASQGPSSSLSSASPVLFSPSTDMSSVDFSVHAVKTGPCCSRSASARERETPRANEPRLEVSWNGPIPRIRCAVPMTSASAEPDFELGADRVKRTAARLGLQPSAAAVQPQTRATARSATAGAPASPRGLEAPPVAPRPATVQRPAARGGAQGCVAPRDRSRAQPPLSPRASSERAAGNAHLACAPDRGSDEVGVHQAQDFDVAYPMGGYSQCGGYCVPPPHFEYGYPFQYGDGAYPYPVFASGPPPPGYSANSCCQPHDLYMYEQERDASWRELEQQEVMRDISAKVSELQQQMSRATRVDGRFGRRAAADPGAERRADMSLLQLRQLTPKVTIEQLVEIKASTTSEQGPATPATSRYRRPGHLPDQTLANSGAASSRTPKAAVWPWAV